MIFPGGTTRGSACGVDVAGESDWRTVYFPCRGLDKISTGEVSLLSWGGVGGWPGIAFLVSVTDYHFQIRNSSREVPRKRVLAALTVTSRQFHPSDTGLFSSPHRMSGLSSAKPSG